MHEFETNIIPGFRPWGEFFYPHNTGCCSNCLFKGKKEFELKPFSFHKLLIAINPYASDADVIDLTLLADNPGRTEEPRRTV